jgi:hypothetical protein
MPYAEKRGGSEYPWRVKREHDALGEIVEARRRDENGPGADGGSALRALPDPRGTGRA